VSGFDVVNGDIKVGDVQPAIDARVRTVLVKKIHAALRKHPEKAAILLFQARSDWTANTFLHQDPYKSEGGEPMIQNSMMSVTIRGERDVIDPKSDGKKIIGKQGYIICPHKNRFASPKVKIPFRIIYGKGVDNSYPLLNYAIWKGYVTGGGYPEVNFNGVQEKLRGIAARSDWVRDHLQELKDDFYLHAEEYFEALRCGMDFEI
jgi:hypothetical protein